MLLCFITSQYLPAIADNQYCISEVRLSERILVLQRGPWKDMMTVLDAGPSLVVIDTWSSPSAAAVGRKLAEHTFQKRVSHILNTHHHWDHIFGNQAFHDAIIVGQAGVPAGIAREYGTEASLRRSMEKIQDIDPSPGGQAYTQAVAQEAFENLILEPPKQLVSKNEELHIGNLTFSLLPTPGMHTPTYMMIYVPELGLLFAPKELGLDRAPKPETGADARLIVAQLERIQSSKQRIIWALLGHFAPIAGPDIDKTLNAWRAINKGN
jgi:glyoxylase-like metal-dependent hydrolase (beta-lactamase superfamily II)